MDCKSKNLPDECVAAFAEIKTTLKYIQENEIKHLRAEVRSVNAKLWILLAEFAVAVAVAILIKLFL